MRSRILWDTSCVIPKDKTRVKKFTWGGIYVQTKPENPNVLLRILLVCCRWAILHSGVVVFHSRFLSYRTHALEWETKRAATLAKSRRRKTKPCNPFECWTPRAAGNKISRAGCLTSEKCVLWRCILSHPHHGPFNCIYLGSVRQIICCRALCAMCATSSISQAGGSSPSGCGNCSTRIVTRTRLISQQGQVRALRTPRWCCWHNFFVCHLTALCRRRTA